MEQTVEPKLSLAAQFDDLCRLQRSVIETQSIEEEVMVLLKSMEHCRLKWLQHEKELIRLSEELKRSQKENLEVNSRRVHLSDTLKNEIAVRERIETERNQFYRKLEMVQNLLMNEDAVGTDSVPFHQARQRVLSALNCKQLSTVHEAASDSDESYSDIEYDKTSEDILDTTAGRPSKGKRKSSKSNGARTPTKDLSKRSRAAADEHDAMDVSEDVGRNIAPLFTRTPRPDPAILGAKTPIKKLTPLFRAETMYNSASKSVAQKTTPAPTYLSCGALNAMAGGGGIGNNVRAHNFVTKKVFRPGEKCGPCSGSIGFCGTCLKCRDCRVTCHPECRTKVPVPCVPYDPQAARQARGNRPLGGTLQTDGQMTPRRGQNEPPYGIPSNSAQKPLFLKPMF